MQTSETFSYCCDLSDFSFEFDLVPKTEQELKFLDSNKSQDTLDTKESSNTESVSEEFDF